MAKQQSDQPLIVPETAELLPISELMQIAEVTEADIDQAVAAWEKSNTDEYQTILKAEPE